MASPPANKAQKIIAGTMIAERYRVTREIGRGGMAQVYEGKHADIGKRIAVKVLSAEFVTSPVVVERFLREARAAAAVRSPYICDVYDSGKLDDGRPFLVMELLEGESLYERMVRVRQFDPRTTVRVITHVARGLTKAHAANIVHRDLKPENVFLTTNEDGEMQAKILDFGLAKFYAPAGEAGAQARLTREGAIFGTPAYMSPEQVQGQGAVDHRADIWALGCIAYECLTGRTVWSTDKGIAMTFAQIASAPLPRLTKYRPDLPRAADAWFEKALSRNIEERYQTAKELAEGFAACLEQGPPSIVVSGDLAALERDGESAPLPSPEAQTSPQAPVVPAGEEETEPAPAAKAPLVSTPAVPSSRRSADLAEVAQRDLTASLVDTGTSNTVKGPREPVEPPKQSSGRGVAVVLGIALAAGAGVVGWQIYKGKAASTQGPAPPSSSAAAATSAPAPTTSSSTAIEPLPAAPKWGVTVNDGQAKLAAGELEEAQKRFREAFDTSGSGVARTMSEHVSVAAANKGPCKLTGLGRMRPFAHAGGVVGRPTVVRSKAGVVAFYTDDHESASHVHAYAVQLDGALRPIAMPIDVTPEADAVGRIEARVVGEQIALAYTDARGQGAGLYGRWLDEKGRIVGPPTPVGPARAGAPAIAAEAGVLWMAWDEKQEGDHVDLMLRKLPGTGQPPPALRITDLRKGRQKVGPPQIAVTGTSLEVLFRLERESNRMLAHLHIPSDDAGLSGGIGEQKRGDDRVVGQLKLLSPPTEKTDAPQIACGVDGCFAVWHIEKGTTGGGAYAALIDPKTGQMIWKKKFASAGGRPSVAIGTGGIGRLAWFEQGKVRTAAITRDGIGTATTLARVAGDQPSPSLVVGATPNEWTIAWLDFEGGKLEPYALRTTCAP